MKKTACYFATKNIYPYLKPAIRSMLKNGGIDVIYVFAENASLGYPVPRNVHVVDVSGQQYFPKDGPNYHSQWTYMVMMKAAVCYLLPKHQRALTMDADTIVTGDLGDLWNLDMTDWCVAGCREPYKAGATMREYVNAGVLFWNLEKMRDGHAARLIKAINEKAYMYVEQDAIAEQLEGKILRIDGGYNSCAFVEPTQTGDRVKHYAARGWDAFMKDDLVQQYEHAEWGR